MPIAKVQLPDGRIARFEVPEGTTPEQVMAFAQQNLPQQPPAAPAAPQDQSPGLMSRAVDFLANNPVTLGLEEGATFGFGAEGNAASLAIGDSIKNLLHGDSANFSQNYKRRLAETEKRMNAEQRTHPILYGGSELAGSLGTGVGAGKALSSVVGAPSGLLGQTVAGIGTGAAAGFVSGVGHGEGDLTDRVKSAGPSTTLGAVLGGAAPGVMAAGGAALRALTTRPAKRAERAVAQTLLNDNVDTNALPGSIARNATTDQVEGSQYSDILPDYAGDATRRLLRGVRSRSAAESGPIDEALQQRYGGAFATQPFTELPEGQAGRVSNTLNRTLGMENDAEATLHALKSRVDAEGAPHYAAAYANAPNITEPGLYHILTATPAGRKAYAAARRTAQNEGRFLPPSLVNPNGGYYALSLRDLDLAKRSLDDQAYLSRAKGSAGKTEQGSQKRLGRTFTELLRRAAPPEYGHALDTYSTGHRLQDAMESGQQLLSKDSRAVRREFSNLNPGEQRAYQVGAYDALRKVIDTAGDNADLVKRIVGSPALRQKLETVIGDKDAVDTLASRIQREARQVLTKQRVQGGSNTADKIADMGNNADAVASAIRQSAYTQSPSAVPLATLGSKLYRGTVGKITSAADAHLARILTEPDVQRQIVNAINLSREAERLRRLQGSRGVGRLGASAAAGNVAGGLLNQ